MTDSDKLKEPESIWDLRRKAPLHFEAKADNARMSAYVLSHIDNNVADRLALAAGYGDTHSIALHEAFRRESSIALELILKAILCIKTKRAPRNTHDVYELWSKAGLPDLSEDDSYRLAEMTEILSWSGRYAAPTNDKNLDKPNERFEKHQKTKPFGKLKIIAPTELGWKEFDAIYQIAVLYFWELRHDEQASPT